MYIQYCCTKQANSQTAHSTDIYMLGFCYACAFALELVGSVMLICIRRLCYTSTHGCISMDLHSLQHGLNCVAVLIATVYLVNEQVAQH